MFSYAHLRFTVSVLPNMRTLQSKGSTRYRLNGLWPCCVLSCLHMTIWQCRPWFGSAQSGLEQSDLAVSSLALHT